MNWTMPSDLRAQLLRLWDRGAMLTSLVTGKPLFPMSLTLTGPTSAEMADHFAEARTWSVELQKMPHCRVEMREFKHRVLGANAIPLKIWIDTLEEAVLLIGKAGALSRFTALIDLIRASQPRLLVWLAKRPIRALDLSDQWGLLLQIVSWIETHPRPGIYLRQIDIPDVHSKFIEAHRGVLMELLDIILPPESIDTTASGVSQFAQRYGLRDKPVRIRFRLLDPQQTFLPGTHIQDITLDSESFALLNPNIRRIFITENEINFLAFPQLKESLVIFGAGYGFEMLSKAEWLSRCCIYYWGDIDTHGFAILDQLRCRFDHVKSFLMDRKTLLAFTSQWGEETKQTRRDLPRLNLEEKELYDDLRDNRIRINLRLEQERIGYNWIESSLSGLM
jgi:hypothetical protein